MSRLLVRLILVLLAAALAAAGFRVVTSADPEYTMRELASCGGFAAYDELIEKVAKKRGVDSALLKALIWRESAFQSDKVGLAGERGLMQIREPAAADWARAMKVESFMPSDLYEPETNLEVGAWYLQRALDRWKDRDDPVPFALAEYNAGITRLDRWVGSTGLGAKATANDLVHAIDYPGTRRYIQDITARATFYRNRGGR